MVAWRGGRSQGSAQAAALRVANGPRLMAEGTCRVEGPATRAWVWRALQTRRAPGVRPLRPLCRMPQRSPRCCAVAASHPGPAGAVLGLRSLRSHRVWIFYNMKRDRLDSALFYSAWRPAPAVPLSAPPGSGRGGAPAGGGGMHAPLLLRGPGLTGDF